MTIYIQHESPGKEKEANWLPTPDGPSWIASRFYWPKPDALDGAWNPPSLIKAE